VNRVPPGEWHDYRRDDSRLGVQPLARNAKSKLEERWSIAIGGGYQEIVAVGDGSHDLLMADAGGLQRISSDGIFRWRTRPFGAHGIAGVFDLDGDGRLEVLTSNGAEIIVISAESGEFLFRDTVGPPHSYGTYAGMFNVHAFFGAGMQVLVPCFSSKEVWMYDFGNDVRGGHVRHRLWMDDGYHPSIAIGDVNTDGTDEIVIARIGGVYVFEPNNGTMISQTVWTSDEERRRNYGHFELVDINRDGRLEAVILSDKVSRHMAVLGNNGQGTFSPLWDRFIEHIYPSDTTELRYTSNSIRDFDGDGRFEIAVSIFNDRKDGRWYTELIRAETGEKILDLPDQYLCGVQDTDGDGRPELCLSHELGRATRPSSELSIYSVRNERTIATLGTGRFAVRAVPTHGRSSEFKPDVFAAHEIWDGRFDGKNGIFFFNPEGLHLLDRSLNTSRVGTDEVSPDARLALATEHALYVSERDGAIKKISAARGTEHFLSCGYHLTTEAHIAARPGPVPCVVRWEESRYLIIPDFSNRIHILSADRIHNRSAEFQGAESRDAKRTTICGRSRIGYDNVFHVPSIILTERGPRIVVVDDEGLLHSRLSLYTLQGVRERFYDFPDLPASEPGNRIGCYDWLWFQHSRGPAMALSFYRSHSMNSECSLGMLIENGEILWRIDRIGEKEFGRGVGPWGTSSIFERDGRASAVFCAKDTLCRIDLETGTFVWEPELLTSWTSDEMKRRNQWKEQSLSTAVSADDPFTAYGTPLILNDDLIIAGCLGGFGSILPSGIARWWHIASAGDVLYRLPGIGDVDGDGKIEWGQGHADGTFRIYDYDSGALRASLDLKAITTDVLTLDIDGDTNPEFIFGTNDGRLLAIGFDGKTFAVIGEQEMGASVGSPIAADFDGDGSSEIYLVTADGRLRCFA